MSKKLFYSYIKKSIYILIMLENIGYNNTPGITINNSGGRGAHNNMPPYIVLNYIIKY